MPRLSRPSCSRRLTFRVQMRDVDIAQCLELAEQTGLTVYDASYLWLARDMGVSLVTLDRKLAAAT